MDVYYDLDTEILYLMRKDNNDFFNRPELENKSLYLYKELDNVNNKVKLLEYIRPNIMIWFITHSRVNQNLLDTHIMYNKLLDTLVIEKQVIQEILNKNIIIEIKYGLKDKITKR